MPFSYRFAVHDVFHDGNFGDALLFVQDRYRRSDESREGCVSRLGKSQRFPTTAFSAAFLGRFWGTFWASAGLFLSRWCFWRLVFVFTFHFSYFTYVRSCRKILFGDFREVSRYHGGENLKSWTKATAWVTVTGEIEPYREQHSSRLLFLKMFCAFCLLERLIYFVNLHDMTFFGVAVCCIDNFETTILFWNFYSLGKVMIVLFF